MNTNLNATSVSIAAQNDLFRRRGFITGKAVLTQGVDALPRSTRNFLIKQVIRFNDFDEANNPWCEHDFGKVTIDGVDYFWKIDYFDACFEFGSEEPENPDKTRRLITIMRADEY